MKQILTVVFLSVTIFLFAQEQDSLKSWSIGGEGNLNFSNTGFGDYYAAGGLNTSAINGLLNAYANKTYKNNASFTNSLRVDHGISRIENTNDDNFIKASDVVEVISKYGTPLKQSDKWFATAAFNMLTQLTQTRTPFDETTGNFTDLLGIAPGETYGTRQSSGFAPADLSLSIGAEYKPNEHFSAFIGPLSGKLRVIGNDDIARAGLFGNEINIENGVVTSYETTRLEAGTNIISSYNNKFLTNEMLSFKTDLVLFSNYLEDPQNVDINWNTVTSLNPWKFVAITYTTELAYDDNKIFTNFSNGSPTGSLDKGIQFRNVLGVGLVHKFGDNK